MEVLKKINKFCGMMSLMAFIVTVLDIIYIVGDQPNNMLYYVSSTVFILFGALFLFTALIFILRDLIWHIRNKHIGRFVAHYIYAAVAIYLICILSDYVFNGKVDLLSYLGYSLCVAVLQIYIDGYKLNSGKISAN